MWVTSSVVSMKAKTRTRENCWRSACTSSRVKWLNPATEPDTSHSTTNSGRAGRGLASTTSIGTPPVDIDLRSVLRRSIDPARVRRRRAASRVASVRASGATTLRIVSQLLAGRAQELDVLGKLWDAVHLDVVAAELLGGAPLGLGVDHFAQLGNLLRGKRFGDLLLGRRGLVAIGGEQSGQQLALQFIQGHRLERLIRRERRAAAGVVFAVGLHDPRDHRHQPLVHVGELGVVVEQIQQHLAHRLDVVGRQAVTGIAASSVPWSSRTTARAPKAAGNHRSNIAS